MSELVIAARERDLGGGIRVGRVLPFIHRRMVGPFIFFDHFGPLTFAPNIPRSADVRPHPHIGLSTVTYLFEGEITHRDSLAVEQAIRPAEVNWMTAGRGISHSERFDGLRQTGGAVHGIQAWVALPESAEESEPAFEHYGAEELAVAEDAGVRMRVIAGSAFGVASTVKTHSPLYYVHIELEANAQVNVPSEQPERALFVAKGTIEHGARRLAAGNMLVLDAGSTPTITAIEPSRVMLLGGEPLGTRHIWWNFVSSRKDRIEQAKADWRAGRIPLPTYDSNEFIPLPDEPRPPAEPLS